MGKLIDFIISSKKSKEAKEIERLKAENKKLKNRINELENTIAELRLQRSVVGSSMPIKTLEENFKTSADPLTVTCQNSFIGSSMPPRSVGNSDANNGLVCGDISMPPRTLM